MNINFGTDGWRGIIAEDFTFENVKIASQAIADYLNRNHKKPKILIGYDTRFLSKEFGETVAAVLAGNNVEVLLTDKPTPTPAVSYGVVVNKLSGAVIITASHNLPKYNGLKFKGYYGGPAFPAITAEIEKQLGKNPVKTMRMEEGKNKKIINMVDIMPAYIKKLKSYVNLPLIKKNKFNIVIDPMFGAGKGIISSLLSKGKCRVTEINKDDNPLFGGGRPEPIEENLKPLIKAVKALKADVGLATDGDADRIGVVDGKVNFVDAQHVISLLLLHLVKNRKMSGGVVRTNAVTYCLEKIAKAYNLPVFETPVGFKHVADLMLKHNILIGGEESGGIGFANYVPERDGILASLLILEMMAMLKKPLHKIIEEMEKEFGKFRYRRMDITIEENVKQKFLKFIAKFTPKEIKGVPLKEKTSFDGMKFILVDGSWLLMRASGTEPILRVYAESSDSTRAKELLQYGIKLTE